MQNRRQFITNLVRGGILVSLTLLSGIMIRRWDEADECRRGFACGNCTLSERCTLPEAGQYREIKKGSGKTGTKDGRERK
jgi:hypothetical protein